MGFLVGLVIGFLLGASKFKSAIVEKTKKLLSKVKKEVEDSIK